MAAAETTAWELTVEALRMLGDKRDVDAGVLCMRALDATPDFLAALLLLRAVRLGTPDAPQLAAAPAPEALRAAVDAAPDARYAEMERFLVAALECGGAAAQFLSGVWRDYARGERDAAEALFVAAAQPPSALACAQCNAGVCRERAGDGAGALRWYGAARAQGHALAAHNAALMRLNGTAGTPVDEAEAVRLLQGPAAAGLAHAQHSLAWCHAAGAGGLRVDAAEAARLYALAAAQGYAPAALQLGRCWQTGAGVGRVDTALAERWYEDAARKGNAEAQYSLACMLQQRGEDAEACVLLHIAAGQGHAAAQNNLGVCYRVGRGVPPDSAAAARFFAAAAAQGRASAQCNLAQCYRTGKGVPRDEAKARELFGLAAAQGDQNAIRALAMQP